MTNEEQSRVSARIVRQRWEGKVDPRELASIEQDAYEFFLKERTR